MVSCRISISPHGTYITLFLRPCSTIHYCGCSKRRQHDAKHTTRTTQTLNMPAAGENRYRYSSDPHVVRSTSHDDARSRSVRSNTRAHLRKSPLNVQTAELPRCVGTPRDLACRSHPEIIRTVGCTSIGLSPVGTKRRQSSPKFLSSDDIVPRPRGTRL